MRLVLKAAFDRFSGYGNDAVDLAVNLEKAGVDVTVMPTALLPGLPRSFTRLLEKDPRGPKDVAMWFAAPYQIEPWELSFLARKCIGYSMWERLPLLVSDLTERGWNASGHDPLPDRFAQRRAYAGLDHMAVTCQMNVEAFHAIDDQTPMSSIPCGIEEADWPVRRRDPQHRLTFLMVGMLNGRKDPFLVLDAWKFLKQQYPEFDARLVLHTQGPGLHPMIVDGAYGPDITLSERSLDRDGLIALYHDADVMISVSRGEGNNKPAMEFMATGGMVMASDWSGHQNWLHPDMTVALGGDLVPAIGAPAAVEFQVRPDLLRQAIVDAWHDRAGVALKGFRSSVWIRQVCSWPVVIDRLVKTMESL